ncbi:MAG: hypothetical protein ACLSAH_12465 [Bilophila wadsworthia]
MKKLQIAIMSLRDSGARPQTGARGKAQEQPSPEPRQRVPQGHLREGAGGGRPHPGHGHHAQREEERPAQAEPGMDVVHQRLDQPHDQEVAERQPPEVDEIRVEVAGKRQIGRAEHGHVGNRQHPADEGHKDQDARRAPVRDRADFRRGEETRGRPRRNQGSRHGITFRAVALELISMVPCIPMRNTTRARRGRPGCRGAAGNFHRDALHDLVK